MYMGYAQYFTGEQRAERKHREENKFAEELEAGILRQLDEKQQKEYLEMCRKLQIDKFDLEMFRILSLFQYQKRYLDDLPAEIEKHKKRLEEHGEELTRLSEQAADGANEIEKHLETIKEFAAQTENPITKVKEMAEEVVETTAENLHKVMRDNLKDMEVEAGQAMQGMRDEIYANLNNIFVNVQETFENDIQKSLQINNLDVINQSVAEVAKSRLKTAEKIKEDTQVLNKELDAIKELRKEYRADVRAIKWANWRWCSASMLVIVLCSWIFFYFHYQARLDNDKSVIVRQVAENQAVLSTLAKANRRLELANHENGNKMLLIRNSKGWTTFENHGVIEFK